MILWSRRARDELLAIGADWPTRNPAAASALQRTIVAAVERLAGFPALGRPGRVAGTRELVIVGTRYLVAYRIVGKRVEVLTVRHGARRWPNEL